MKRSKRNLAQELMQSLEEFKAHREGKITLRSTKVEPKKPITVSAETITKLRKKHRLSRGVLASRLRIKVRTLEKWEHSKTPIKGAAALLIALVEKYPDTMDRLDSIDEESQ